jgi:TPR repeat protein
LRKSWGRHDNRKKIFDSLNNVYGELEGTYRYAEILDGRSLTTFLLDFGESAKYYRNLSEDRYAPAMGRFGEKLAMGDGLEKNADEAVHWLVTAISRGWLPAVEFAWNQVSSGSELKLERDWIKARFFDEINNCNARAMHIWGMINFRGNGIPVDLKEAHKWLNLAQYFGAKLPRPNYMELIEREISFEQLLETTSAAQQWLLERQKKIRSVAKDLRNLKDRVKTEGDTKWFGIGELFQNGREGFLRHIILAYGCFDLALKSGNQAATTHLEFLTRILTHARTATAVEMTSEFIITGQIPVIE